MRSNNSHGFALAEALVALAIVALLSGLLFGVIRSSAAAQSGLMDRRIALLVAQSALAQAQALPGSGAERSDGEDMRFSWQIERGPAAGDIRSAIPMERITVYVRGRDTGRMLAELTDVRLARR